MDVFSPQKRSQIMASIRSKDTKPELLVRKLTFAMGYRYRIHNARLPGTPDLVFTSRKAVIFVHGCFWHRHKRCRFASDPQTRADYWQAKFARTVSRDLRARKALLDMGWRSMVLWQCELHIPSKVSKKIRRFLEKQPRNGVPKASRSRAQ